MLPLQVLTDGYVLSNTTGTTVQQYAPPYDSGIHHRVGGSGLLAPMLLHVISSAH